MVVRFKNLVTRNKGFHIFSDDLKSPEKIMAYLSDYGVTHVKGVEIVDPVVNHIWAEDCDKIVQFYAETALENPSKLWGPHKALEQLCGIVVEERFRDRYQRRWNHVCAFSAHLTTSRDFWILMGLMIFLQPRN
ncbi:hypothetical protein LINGRAHAP2_LOCUS9447 [Linum grandiflorum]